MQGCGKNRFLFVAAALLTCRIQAVVGGICDETPDESTMLQVVKPVAKGLFLCVDEVLLTYKIRGEFASSVLRIACEAYKECFGKYVGKKPTKEGRNESIDCLVQYVEKNIADDLPTAGQEPRELVAPFVGCFFRRLDLPLENPKRANAVLHWYFEIVRP
ncbi:uncharacterized protein LOC144144621 [Haemaphysalis longicornis]